VLSLPKLVSTRQRYCAKVLPLHELRAGCVPFNVVAARDGRYHRGDKSGDIVSNKAGVAVGDLSVAGGLAF